MTHVFVDQIQPVLVAVQVRRHLDLEGVPLLSRTKSCLKAQESKKMSAHLVMSYCRVVKTDCPEFHPYSAVLIINIKYSTFYKKLNVIYSSIILLWQSPSSCKLIYFIHTILKLWYTSHASCYYLTKFLQKNVWLITILQSICLDLTEREEMKKEILILIFCMIKFTTLVNVELHLWK